MVPHILPPCAIQGRRVTTTVSCSSNSASCVRGSCCMDDTSTCGGIVVPCDAGKYWDTAKAGSTAGTTDALKKSNCCTAKAHCDSFTCAANSLAITDASTTDCD